MTQKSVHCALRVLLLAVALALVFGGGASSAQAAILQFSIQGALWRDDPRGAGYQAWLGVVIDWERLLMRRRPLVSLEDPVMLAQDATELSPEELDQLLPQRAEATEDADPAEEAPTPRRRQRRTTATPPLPKVVPDYPWLSPSFALELVEAVTAYHSLTERDRYLLSMGTRSRTSAALPQLRVKAGRNMDQTLRFSPTVSDPDRWLTSGGAGFRYEAQATWTLDRLVFTRDEISLERVRLMLERERTARMQQALKVFFRWQSAYLRELDPELVDEDRAVARLQRLQAQIELDVLSGGWFSRHLARSNRR